MILAAFPASSARVSPVIKFLFCSFQGPEYWNAMCSRKPIKKPLPRIFCTHPFINTTIKNCVPILIMHTSQIRKNTSTEMNHIGMVPIQKTHRYFWKPPLLLMMGSFHVIASTLVVEHFESFLTFRAQDCPKLPWRMISTQNSGQKKIQPSW